jgi:acyl carrier protein
MNRAEATTLIGQALQNLGALDDAGGLTDELDLIGEGVIDSLDAMMFLFELEKIVGHRITTIDETYTDFTVGGLATALVDDAAAS